MPASADSSTIVAVASGSGPAAIGLVRLSGAEALRIGRAIFHADPPLGRPGRVRRGRVVGVDGVVLDDALGWYLAGPRTYTGEDTVELSTHGSPALLALVVDTACQLGARRAEPGQFTRRAFLNGRLDLVQAEAVADLIQAGSRGGFEVAYGAMSGALSGRLRAIQNQLVEALAFLEAGLDFSEDVVEAEVGRSASLVRAVGTAVTGLIDSFAGARRRLEGFRVAIVGAPNAGKSTLLNRLLGEDRALVSAAPGTTRDWIEVQVLWDGEVIHLVDTAGLRVTDDELEASGVTRSREQASQADVLVQVVDGAERAPVTALPCPAGGALVVALNKSDLPRRAAVAQSLEARAVVVSARTGSGIEELRQRIVAALPGRERAGVGLLRERHVEDLRVVERAASTAVAQLSRGSLEMAAEDLHRALRALGALLGETWDDAVLDRIFAGFCIGK